MKKRKKKKKSSNSKGFLQRIQHSIVNFEIHYDISNVHCLRTFATFCLSSIVLALPLPEKELKKNEEKMIQKCMFDSFRMLFLHD